MLDLNTRLLDLIKIHGHQWTIISKTLTEEGYKTPNGSPVWSKNCARKYFNRALRTDQDPYGPNSILPGIGSVKPVKGFIDWWARTQKPTPEEIDRRPILTGKRQKIGPRVSVDLMNRARKQMREDRVLAQNNFSALIEFLLFRYIGSPEDLVQWEEVSTEKVEQTA